MTLVCVPITVEEIDQALAEAAQAKSAGADLVEFRIDSFFQGAEPNTPGVPEDEDPDVYTVAQLNRLLAESPLPVILTCRSAEEGGDYDGDDADRVSLLEHLCTGDHPPAYLDFELAAYTRSANIRQKINLCVAHPKQQRDVTTRLILSIHDFKARPADLDRRLLIAFEEPACAVVKVAYRARSLRDNLDLFEILQTAPKPTIALGMGEFGLMSRVLAPKFNGYLTFASLRDEAATAPGQPTLDELLNLYRFRTINKETKLYGVIGWPVAQSMSPLIHNAGFEAVGHNGVYLPLPIAADADDQDTSFASYKVTVEALIDAADLGFNGASVTIPHKAHAASHQIESLQSTKRSLEVIEAGAANTISLAPESDAAERSAHIENTDAQAIAALLDTFPHNSPSNSPSKRVIIIGAGGAARAAVIASASDGVQVQVWGRSMDKADKLVREVNEAVGESIASVYEGDLNQASAHAFINCTPLGMAHGSDPDALSIPIPEMTNLDPDTIFFDTVYNPIETPMLKAARERGYRTIDGVQMFVRQAAAQFELWTGKPAPTDLFDQLCRDRLTPGDEP